MKRNGYTKLLTPTRCPECGEPMSKPKGMKITFYCEPCNNLYRIHKIRINVKDDNEG